MYGLIVKLRAVPGRRIELMQVLGGEDSHTVPGCRSFIVGEDDQDQDVLWVTEVWDSEADHKASLQLSQSKPGLTSIETLLAHYERVAVTRPVERFSHPMHAQVD